MLNKLNLSNVGPFDGQGVEIDFKPLTIIIGPNNSGKSTLIYAFDMVGNPNVPPPHVHTYENYTDLLYMKDLDKYAVIDAKFMSSNGVVLNRRITINESRRGIINTIDLVDKQNIHSRRMLPYEEVAVGEFNRSFQNATYLLSDRTFILSKVQLNPFMKANLIDQRGSNIIEFLLNRWTDRDPLWPEAEEWLRKIDPSLVIIKTPLTGDEVSLSTQRDLPDDLLDINISLQGSGIQRAMQIIAALVFTPKGSCVIIEEPEMNLHKAAQEVIVDLINKAVNDWEKQVIITTHSWDILLPYASDLGIARERGKEHIKVDKNKVALRILNSDSGQISINNDVHFAKFSDMKDEIKKAWG